MTIILKFYSSVFFILPNRTSDSQHQNYEYQILHICIILLIMKSRILLTVIFAAVASLRLSSDRRFVNINFSGTRDVSKINYTLTYDTTAGTRGFEGGVKLKNKTGRVVRRQILGTCSSGKCVYQKGIKNLQLQTTFFLRGGGSTSSTVSLP